MLQVTEFCGSAGTLKCIRKFKNEPEYALLRWSHTNLLSQYFCYK